MPFGIEIPWWVYGIIAIIVIIVLYAIYEKLTAYTPAQTAFNTSESALPDNFDAAGQAANASSIISEFFGSDDQNLITTLSNMTDNELIATSNAYNSQYYSNGSKTLLQQIQGFDLIFTTGQTRDNLVTRMTNLGIT